MEVDVKTTTLMKIDIEATEAFRILCKALQMDFVLDEDKDYFVSNGSVCTTENGHDRCFDDRGDLFVALRNVAVNMFPNVRFRSDSYIYPSTN